MSIVNNCEIDLLLSYSHYHVIALNIDFEECLKIELTFLCEKGRLNRMVKYDDASPPKVEVTDGHINVLYCWREVVRIIRHNNSNELEIHYEVRVFLL